MNPLAPVTSILLPASLEFGKYALIDMLHVSKVTFAHITFRQPIESGPQT